MHPLNPNTRPFPLGRDMRVINIICDRIWIVRGLAAILEATLKSDCAWIPPCSSVPYHSSCNLIPIHFSHCCVLYWKPYQADLDHPIWIFVILSHLVDFKLIRIFAWHSLGHSERPYLTFNYHTAFVEAKIHLFWCVCMGCPSACLNKEKGRQEKRMFGCLHFVSLLDILYRCMFMETVHWCIPHKSQ